ncbi:MAG: hypothetical protein IJM79_06650 [Erysipelotrichaceae bacterium]|nr:hypothetical protein [Erysipelotrichaceae bacterium]
MKKIIVFFVLLLLMISGCSDKQDEIQIFNPGEVVSSDIVDFKLNDAQLTYYANAHFDPKVFGLPADNETEAFVAEEGHIFVVMSFAFRNNGRASIRVGNDAESTYNLHFTVNYDGKKYRVNGHESNPATGLSMEWSVISRIKGIDQRICISESSVSVESEEVLYVRMIGVASFEPGKLTDSFELTVNVINSQGGYEEFTYNIPSSSPNDDKDF